MTFQLVSPLASFTRMILERGHHRPQSGGEPHQPARAACAHCCRPARQRRVPFCSAGPEPRPHDISPCFAHLSRPLWSRVPWTGTPVQPSCRAVGRSRERSLRTSGDTRPGRERARIRTTRRTGRPCGWFLVSRLTSRWRRARRPRGRQPSSALDRAPWPRASALTAMSPTRQTWAPSSCTDNVTGDGVLPEGHHHDGVALGESLNNPRGV